jgi:hypothetical protein
MSEEKKKKEPKPSLEKIINHSSAKPINIPTKDKNRFRNPKIGIEYEYEVIDKDNFDKIPRSMPLKQKTLTESFKEYLFSSLKQSYKYITNNKSI